MAKKILLCSPDTVKGILNISDELQEKFLIPALNETQDEGFESVVGSEMVRKLQDLVSGNTIGTEGNEMYKALLEKAKYYFAYGAATKLVIIASYHISNAGVTQPTDENKTNLSFNDIVSMQGIYEKKFDFYTKKLQDWCWANIDQLPELKSCKKGDVKANLSSAASTSIWLGGARGRCKKKPYSR